MDGVCDRLGPLKAAFFDGDFGVEGDTFGGVRGCERGCGTGVRPQCFGALQDESRRPVFADFGEAVEYVASREAELTVPRGTQSFDGAAFAIRIVGATAHFPACDFAGAFGGDGAFGGAGGVFADDIDFNTLARPFRADRATERDGLGGSDGGTVDVPF